MKQVIIYGGTSLLSIEYIQKFHNDLMFLSYVEI